jgi:hypothetical protein
VPSVNLMRRNPECRATKLLQIRNSLGLSQRGLIRQMGLTDDLTQAEVSTFESGWHVPSLLVLKEYADMAGIGLMCLCRMTWIYLRICHAILKVWASKEMYGRKETLGERPNANARAGASRTQTGEVSLP